MLHSHQTCQITLKTKATPFKSTIATIHMFPKAEIKICVQNLGIKLSAVSTSIQVFHGNLCIYKPITFSEYTHQEMQLSVPSVRHNICQNTHLVIRNSCAACVLGHFFLFSQPTQYILICYLLAYKSMQTGNHNVLL